MNTRLPVHFSECWGSLNVIKLKERRFQKHPSALLVSTRGQSSLQFWEFCAHITHVSGNPPTTVHSSCLLCAHDECTSTTSSQVIVFRTLALEGIYGPSSPLWFMLIMNRRSRLPFIFITWCCICMQLYVMFLLKFPWFTIIKRIPPNFLSISDLCQFNTLHCLSPYTKCLTVNCHCHCLNPTSGICEVARGSGMLGVLV